MPLQGTGESGSEASPRGAEVWGRNGRALSLVSAPLVAAAGTETSLVLLQAGNSHKRCLCLQCACVCVCVRCAARGGGGREAQCFSLSLSLCRNRLEGTSDHTRAGCLRFQMRARHQIKTPAPHNCHTQQTAPRLALLSWSAGDRPRASATRCVSWSIWPTSCNATEGEWRGARFEAKVLASASHRQPTPSPTWTGRPAGRC
jgi:hypothetical protein